MKKILFLLSLIILMIGCSKDNDDSDESKVSVKFTFSHHWDGQAFTKDHFDLFDYINEYGSTLSMNHLIYLISDIKFIREDGSLLNYEGFPYVLVNIENNLALENPDAGVIPKGNYKGIIFTFGFKEELNISGAYPDLNSASWNWPEMIGGGYHYMQLEGKYINDIGAEMPFAYHMGPTVDENDVRDNNHFVVTINQNFSVDNTLNVHIQMNLAEWFKNPYTWDLNVYDVNLMMNYEAQKLMQDNGKDVFNASFN